MRQSSSNQSDAARRNQVEVLNFLQANGVHSRVDIAAHIRLTKATVTNLINEMIGAGILVERGESPTETQRRRGRRKTMLDINENHRLVFGIAMGADSLRVGLTNLNGDILSRSVIPLADHGYRERLETIVSQIESLSHDNCITNDMILGAGICLDRSAEAGIDGETLAEKLLHLKRDLSHALSFPIITTTTCIGALLAQKLWVDRLAQNLLLFRCGKETGSAAMTNGQIYHGVADRAGGFPVPTECGDTPEEIILRSAAVFDPERVLLFGDSFEEHDEMETTPADRLRLLSEQHGTPCLFTPAAVTEATSFLAGCAAATASCFYLWKL